MMKKLKQFGALMLALVLAVALCCPALAAGEKGSITIDNAIEGQTYTIYRIFDLDTHNAGYTANTYKVTEAWKGFFQETNAGATYATLEGDSVTWKEDMNTAENAKTFAAAAIQYAMGNNIANNGTQTADSSEVKFENLELGYYLVQSNLGVLCALDTAKPDVTMKEKNSATIITKQVQEDSDNQWGNHNDADIGQTVDFKTTITVKDGDPKGYTLHDKMSEGLSFTPKSVKVFINGTEAATGFTVENPATDNCTFDVKFNDGTLKANDVVTVTYSAVLNDKAVIAGEGNVNTTYLKYGNNTTAESQTRTYTWEMSAYKYTQDTEGQKIALKDAQFVLYKEVNGQRLYAMMNANNKITGWTAQDYSSNEAEKATLITTPDSGKFTISGLDADTYYLEEIKAPDGYNKLKGAIEVVISANIANNNTGTATVKYGEKKTAAGEDGVLVLNNAGTELPTTGGMGTTVLYVVGGVLVVCAGVALVAKKRMQ